MDTQTSDKLVRFGKVLNVVGIVLAVICLIAAAISLLGIVLVALIPEDAIFGFFNTVQLSSTFSVFQAGTVLSELVPLTALVGLKLTIIFILLTSLTYSIVSAIILFILSKVSRSTVTHRSPFLPENVKRLKIIGVILIIATLFLGWQSLIFAFCLLAFAFVFQYGTELQQQADETL